MCKPDGSPKGFQTKLKSLAEIKAEKTSRRLGKKIRIYFCIYCKNWCLTSQSLKQVNSYKRKKRALRPQICVWEGEGGALHPNELEG